MQLKSIVPTEPNYTTRIDGGGGVLLYVTYLGVEKVFSMTSHAVEQLTARFYRNAEIIGSILANGDIYTDLEHGGYAIYYGSNAVCIASDLTTIKTVMDNVSIWEKLRNAVWAIQHAIRSLW